MAIVVGPYGKTLQAKARTELFRAVGQRSRPWAWGAIAVLIVTGPINLVLMGVPLHALTELKFYASGFGSALGWKLIAVAVLLMVTAVHDLSLPHWAARLRARQAAGETTPELAAQAARHRIWARTMGRLNLVLAVVVVLLATRLVALT